MIDLVIGLVGPGLVGKALLQQIQAQAGHLHSPMGVALKICGVANSRKMVVAETSKKNLDPSRWQDRLKEGEASDLQKFMTGLRQHKGHAVLIDCSASGETPKAYAGWLSQAECSLITPNKQLGAGPQGIYDSVFKACQESGNQFYYEATVGAGLPVITTLQGLLRTGDNVEAIEGIFSGTLSYIFNTFGSEASFSQIVSKAKVAGFTEPDPREDLSGMDVARKVVILARECGMKVDLEDVEVESLVPGPLQATASADAFLEQLPQYDGEWKDRAAEASAQDMKLCYVGRVDVQSKQCSVGLKAYPKDHAFAQLQGADNIISFKTARYAEQPLFIRGPGAGAEVTAAGIFSDLLLLAQSLGARLR